MKSRLATLFCLFAVAACGTDTPKEAGVPGGGGLPALPGPTDRRAGATFSALNR